MNSKKLMNYYTVFMDAWQLFKKYSEPIENDEFWKSFVSEADDLYKKHGQVSFSDKLIGLVVEEIENEWKRGLKYDDTWQG